MCEYVAGHYFDNCSPCYWVFMALGSVFSVWALLWVAGVYADWLKSIKEGSSDVGY